MTSPNYAELTRFLMEPLLDSPDHLKVSTEVLGGGARIWVRVALHEAADRGRFLGRGGRNLQAVRHILKAAGDNASQQVTLEVFGAEADPEEGSRIRLGGGPGSDRPVRRDETAPEAAGVATPKPKPRLRKRGETPEDQSL